MLDLFSDMELTAALMLGLALFFVLAYEFINGFHDTANAVATVIYTKAMPAHLAVIGSGIFNFLGVMLGGLGVAYAIVHLLPVDLLLNVGVGHGLYMVYALLAAAIIWNLGTWYLGIPASSSHTLIGSIMGVGIANALMNNQYWLSGINTKKAIDILLSLLISPTVGLVMAGLMLLALKKWRPDSRMHMTPEERKNTDGKKHPPFWTRTTLIASAMGMSFAHGSNDGQKGIGLLMLVLIGLAPAKFALDIESTSYQIERTVDAAKHMGEFYESNRDRLNGSLDLSYNSDHPLPVLFKCESASTLPAISTLVEKLNSVKSYESLSGEDRRVVRRILLCLDDTAKKASKLDILSKKEKADLDRLRKDLSATTEYAPQWVIVAVALALGLGTMVGWKRIVLTVGEKIGNKGMTYSQGNAAQLTAAAAIGVASWTGMPVSTTHILSSAVAGTMIANKSGLQGGTVKSIVIAWVLTLPATMLLSGGLFWAASVLFA
ncbi:inorganic phosphate transporter [Chitinibacter bivalviorum]|uniref:Phosphate transporter n=1 Tax=Chitinibacter bivalviorum TaxID=2739434 RepID=A0A7H9BH78_9NEIS|nr:inorganic phosphate transporter [Chitinibacter bivalviorum]QLG87977.1 inorganic phosphate transporter [Chitinibacter bivalviorum]